MSSFPEEFDRSLLTLLELADLLSADWMLIGGVAVASWGRPRATTDIDFALSVSMDLAAQVDGHLTQYGWAKVGGPGQIKDTGVFLVQYARNLGEGRELGLDVFFTMTDWQRQALSRRKEVSFRGRAYWVASPEDVLIYKLIANRGIDQADVDNILDRRFDQIDQPYLSSWVRTLGIEDRWQEALTRLHDRRDLGF